MPDGTKPVDEDAELVAWLRVPTSSWRGLSKQSRTARLEGGAIPPNKSKTQMKLRSSKLSTTRTKSTGLRSGRRPEETAADVESAALGRVAGTTPFV
jgi:hypothetical protein